MAQNRDRGNATQYLPPPSETEVAWAMYSLALNRLTQESPHPWMLAHVIDTDGLARMRAGELSPRAAIRYFSAEAFKEVDAQGIENVKRALRAASVDSSSEALDENALTTIARSAVTVPEFWSWLAEQPTTGERLTAVKGHLAQLRDTVLGFEAEDPRPWIPLERTTLTQDTINASPMQEPARTPGQTAAGYGPGGPIYT